MSSTDWLSRKEATQYLNSIGYPAAPQTLANLAAHGNRGNGPPFRRLNGKRVRYTKDELRRWAEARTEEIR